LQNIIHHFPTINANQLQQLEQLQDIFLDWNTKVNLISRKDTAHFIERHVLHSLAIAKVVNFPQESLVLDVGTGGGFPGIPLAILFPNVQFHLVDSIGKKIMVVNEVVQHIGLNNVKAEQIRAENVTNQYHYVVSRAVTRLKAFIPWITGKLINEKESNFEHTGLLYLKGGDISEEISEISPKKSTIYNLSTFFEEAFFETKKIVHVPSSELIK